MKYSVIYGKGIRIDDFKDISSARMYAYDVARRTAEVQIWGGDYYGCETFRGLVKRMKKKDITTLRFGEYYQEGVTYYKSLVGDCGEYILNKDGSLGKKIW